MVKSELVKKYAGDEEERLLLARALDKAAAFRDKNIPQCTCFLTPAQALKCEKMLAASGETSWEMFGGYDGAERKAAVFIPDWLTAEQLYSDPELSPLKCLLLRWRREDALSHRDILGALMGVGIAREAVGDILVGEGRCHVLVLRDVVKHLLSDFDKAGRVKLSAEEIPLSSLEIPEPKTKERRDTVASLRLDSVVSSAFSMSREKAAELIRAGKVRLDEAECLKPDRAVSQGAVLSARGFGKAVLSEAGYVTKKGRIAIVIKKYI